MMMPWWMATTDSTHKFFALINTLDECNVEICGVCVLHKHFPCVSFFTRSPTMI